jgi:trk system potassium uptake protein TrkH
MSRDREVRLALFAVVVLPTLLFTRHWIGALEVDDGGQCRRRAAALWGGVFTVLSFLTTTGFVSDSWDVARTWSGLQTPGLLLVGLVLMGGGVATTAGGLKLLRVYALYKHGAREMGKLVHPNSVAGAGRWGGASAARAPISRGSSSCSSCCRWRRDAGAGGHGHRLRGLADPGGRGAFTTTGPLAEVAGEAPISYLALSDPAKLILAAAMIVGRLETLVLIALSTRPSGGVSRRASPKV